MDSNRKSLHRKAMSVSLDRRMPPLSSFAIRMPISLLKLERARRAWMTRCILCIRSLARNYCCFSFSLLAAPGKTSCAIIGKLAQLTTCPRRANFVRTSITSELSAKKRRTLPKLVPHLDRATIEYVASNGVTYRDIRGRPKKILESLKTKFIEYVEKSACKNSNVHPFNNRFDLDKKKS